MHSRKLICWTSAGLLLLGGCNFAVNVGAGASSDHGPDIVLKGEAVQAAQGGCVFWRAEDGREFTLFQDKSLANDEFDSVITPGVKSRILLHTDQALGTACQPDAAVALVLQVLEINGVDVAPAAAQALSEKWREFELALEDAASAIQARVQDFADTLRGRAEAFRDEAQQALEDKKASIRAGLPDGDDDLANAFDDAMETIQEHLAVRIDEIRSNLELGGDGFLVDLRQAAADVREQFRAGVDDLDQKLQDRADELGDALEAKRGQIKDRLDGVKSDLRDRFEARAEDLRDRLEQRITDRLEAWKANILAIVESLPDRINPDDPELGNQLPAITEDIVGSMDDELNLLLEERDELVADLESNLAQLDAELQTTATSSIAGIEAELLAAE